MGFEVLHGIVDCPWVIGEPISVFKEAVERETGILTEVDTYDWITFLPMTDGTGAYNRYFGRLNTGKMKIRGVMARKGDTPEYVNKMQQEVFEKTGFRASTTSRCSRNEVYAAAPGRHRLRLRQFLDCGWYPSAIQCLHFRPVKTHNNAHRCFRSWQPVRFLI
jgi:hypothetical protein